MLRKSDHYPGFFQAPGANLISSRGARGQFFRKFPVRKPPLFPIRYRLHGSHGEIPVMQCLDRITRSTAQDGLN